MRITSGVGGIVGVQVGGINVQVADGLGVCVGGGVYVGDGVCVGGGVYPGVWVGVRDGRLVGVRLGGAGSGVDCPGGLGDGVTTSQPTSSAPAPTIIPPISSQCQQPTYFSGIAVFLHSAFSSFEGRFVYAYESY